MHLVYLISSLQMTFSYLARPHFRKLQFWTNVLVNLWHGLGQKVNTEKSSVHFSKNFRGQPMVAILDQLRLKKLPSKAKHLGLPLLIPRAKVGVANEIKAKFLQKISGWKAKTLSQAGRTCMIKPAAGSIPSYLLSFYSMPQNWCRDIDRELKNFW